MVKAMIIVWCALLGGFVGYEAGVFLACGLLRAGNLCGLLGVFVTGPIGLAAGAVAGVVAVRRKVRPGMALAVLAACSVLAVAVVYVMSLAMPAE